jgi:hypothetical protein
MKQAVSIEQSLKRALQSENTRGCETAEFFSLKINGNSDLKSTKTPKFG